MLKDNLELAVRLIFPSATPEELKSYLVQREGFEKLKGIEPVVKADGPADRQALDTRRDVEPLADTARHVQRAVTHIGSSGLDLNRASGIGAGRVEGDRRDASVFTPR